MSNGIAPASFKVRDCQQSQNDAYLQCPYEKSHLIQPGRMQVHLGKCAKRPEHSSNQGIVCTFNYTHHLENEAEYSKHLQECPDRHKMNRALYQEELQQESAPPPTAPVAYTLPEQEENWDQTNAPTYNPKTAYENTPLIQAPRGLSKADRKKFRVQQRIRYNRIASGVEPEEDQNEKK